MDDASQQQPAEPPAPPCPPPADLEDVVQPAPPPPEEEVTPAPPPSHVAAVAETTCFACAAGQPHAVEVAKFANGPLQRWAERVLQQESAAVTCLDCFQNVVQKSFPSQVFKIFFSQTACYENASCTGSGVDSLSAVLDSSLSISDISEKSPRRGRPPATVTPIKLRKLRRPKPGDFQMCEGCDKLISSQNVMHKKRLRCTACGTTCKCYALLREHQSAEGCFKVKNEDEPEPSTNFFLPKRKFKGEYMELQPKKIQRLSEETSLDHVCETCQQRFAKSSHLFSHRRAHCYKCVIPLPCKTALATHIERGHPEEKFSSDEDESIHECPHCKDSYVSEEAFKQHTQVTTCDVCNVEFNCLGLLKTHKIKSNKLCRHCKTNFHGEQQLQAHKEQNTCLGCHGVYSCKTLALRHIAKCKKCILELPDSTSKTQSDGETNGKAPSLKGKARGSLKDPVHHSTPKKKSFICKFCRGKNFGRRELANHQSEENCTCSCGKRLKCRTNLNIHVSRLGHSAQVPNEISKKSFVCQYCAHDANSLGRLQKHQRNSKCRRCFKEVGCTRMAIQHCKDSPQEAEGPSEFACSHCQSNLKSKNEFQKHQQTKFCSKCHWKAPCVSLLMAHGCGRRSSVKMAPQEEPEPAPPAPPRPVPPPPQPQQHVEPLSLADTHRCPYCATICPSAEVLQRHSLPTNCPRCGFAQPCSVMLAQHLDACQFNLAGSVHRCPLCCKLFSSAALLGGHVQTCTASRPRTMPSHSCDVCGKLYRTAKKLQKHKDHRHVQGLRPSEAPSELDETIDNGDDDDEEDCKLGPVLIGSIHTFKDDGQDVFGRSIEIKTEIVD